MTMSLCHIDAVTQSLGDPAVKPTSRTGQHEATAHVHGEENTLEVGVWACEQGEFTAARDGVTEVCQILSGSATVAGEDGNTAEVSAGSLLVLPAGWRGTWTVHADIRKTYVLVTVPSGQQGV